jgi:hypothetical protein
MSLDIRSARSMRWIRTVATALIVGGVTGTFMTNVAAFSCCAECNDGKSAVCCAGNTPGCGCIGVWDDGCYVSCNDYNNDWSNLCD